MASKIQIKAGQVEFLYEGDSDLTVQDMVALFAHVEALYSVAGDEEPVYPNAENSGSVAVAPAKGASGGALAFHVNTVAEKLGGKSCTDIALAAAAYLQLCEDKDSFSRSDLLNTMKQATKHFKVSMGSNLTSSINTLLNGKINQIANDKYSISANEIASLKTKLAQ